MEEMTRKSLFPAMLLAVAIIQGLPQTAAACSYAGNTYEWARREPLDELFHRSASVERVRVQAGEASACPRWPSLGAEDEEWDRYYVAAGEKCAPDPFTEAADFSGIVQERLKGAAPATIALRPDRGEFGDIRRFSVVDEELMAGGERARAAEGHARPQFWMEGDVGFARNGLTSCGGNPVLVSGMDYVVFRDRAGKVIAAEPVSRDDDEFLGWLRRRPGDAANARIFTPQQAFAATPEMALVEITHCPPASAPQTGNITARLIRGSPGALFASETTAGAETETYSLREWLAFHRMRCRPMTLLVVMTSAYPAPAPDRGKPQFQARAWVPPMPAVISDGSVRMSDLFPGVHLSGPDRVMVDQAFVWQQPGRLAWQADESAGPAH
jgi:hypothetical protein